MKRIVIIGNGFDLAHGLKTSYNDFIKYIINKSINYDEIIRKEMIDVGTLSSDYQTYDFISKNLTDIRKYASRFGGIHFPNMFFKELISYCFDKDWFDIETFYFNTLCATQLEHIDKLQSEFELIKKHLQIYLKEVYETNTFEINPSFLEIFREKNPQSLLFINFNYTTTIHKYFNALWDIKIKTVINIHGDLYDLDNPIVFGYGDDKDTKYIEIIHKRINKYLRNLKRQQYNLANQYSQIKQILDVGDNFEVYTIGHSLGLSDKTLLKEIFERKTLEKIKLYYFNDFENFRDLNDNIRRIVNDEAFSKVINYTKSDKIPQSNSST